MTRRAAEGTCGAAGWGATARKGSAPPPARLPRGRAGFEQTRETNYYGNPETLKKNPD